jgi:hypothetical protein
MNTRPMTNAELVRLSSALDGQIWIEYSTGDRRNKAKVSELLNRWRSVNERLRRSRI